MLENINGRDVQRKNVVSNVDEFNFMGTMTRWPVQKHKEHHKIFTPLFPLLQYPLPDE